MEQIVQVVQTLGFPIACVIGLGIFAYKFITRIQDENQAREQNYREMLTSYGAKMADIASALAEIKNDIGDLKNNH